ncbi:MAG: hypothetical protein WCJ57_02315 [Candidatus Falkowbacteria bacterium]
MHYILAAVIRYDEDETENVMDYLATAKSNFILAVSKELEKPLLRFDAKFLDGEKEHPLAKLDEWEIDDIITPGDFLTNLPEAESVPQAVLTPELEWIDSEASHSGNSSESWEERIKKIVLSAGDSCLVALIRCHI